MYTIAALYLYISNGEPFMTHFNVEGSILEFCGVRLHSEC